MCHRPDLAERFFKEAILLDPGNRKYQANLNRFYEAVPQVAVRTTREEAPALAGLTPQPQAAASQPVQALANVSQISSVSFQPTSGRMQRVSASEVMIGARPAVAAAAPDGRRRAATVAAAPAAVVQDRRRRNPNYPVRLGIGSVPAPKAAAISDSIVSADAVTNSGESTSTLSVVMVLSSSANPAATTGSPVR